MRVISRFITYRYARALFYACIVDGIGIASSWIRSNDRHVIWWDLNDNRDDINRRIAIRCDDLRSRCIDSIKHIPLNRLSVKSHFWLLKYPTNRIPIYDTRFNRTDHNDAHFVTESCIIAKNTVLRGISREAEVEPPNSLFDDVHTEAVILTLPTFLVQTREATIE